MLIQQLRIAILIFVVGCSLINAALLLRQHTWLGQVQAIAIPHPNSTDSLDTIFSTPDPAVVWNHNQDVRAHILANETALAWELAIITVGGMVWFLAPVLTRNSNL
jgi:hypothetical protein